MKTQKWKKKRVLGGLKKTGGLGGAKGRIAVDSSERGARTFRTLLSHVKEFGC